VKRFRYGEVDAAKTDKRADGVEVPMPSAPVDVIVVVPVCPAAKRLERYVTVKRLVDVALASVALPVTVSAPEKVEVSDDEVALIAPT
jgi:hypothetical protein